jgi:capsular polysaccharide biosynthesis protein
MELEDNGTGILKLNTNFNFSVGIFSLDSGHVVSVRNSYQFFLSGQHLNDIRKTRKNSTFVYTDVIPLPRQYYYYHFLAEEMPEILKALTISPTLYVLTHENQPHWVFDVLEAFKVKYITTSHLVATIKNATIPIFANPRGSWSTLLLRNSLEKKSELKNNRNILILRPDLDRSSIELDQILVRICSAYDYELINPSEFRFVEQVAIFQEANSIIALHGGSLTNLIFCNPGVHVLELFTHPYRNFDFRNIAKEQDFSYVGMDANQFDIQEQISSYLEEIHE